MWGKRTLGQNESALDLGMMRDEKKKSLKGRRDRRK